MYEKGESVKWLERLWECNMLEERGEELRQERGAVHLSFHTFEIKTLRAQIKSFHYR